MRSWVRTLVKEEIHEKRKPMLNCCELVGYQCFVVVCCHVPSLYLDGMNSMHVWSDSCRWVDNAQTVRQGRESDGLEKEKEKEKFKGPIRHIQVNTYPSVHPPLA